jgi:two-component system NtrC family response regulator
MNFKRKLLIVEDDVQVARQLKWGLSDEYEVHLAKDASSTLKKIAAEKPQVVTLDLGLPPRPKEALVGMKLLGQILQSEPDSKIIVVTGNDDRENAMKAISQGAWDYYQKPIDTDELKIILKRAFHVRLLEGEYHQQQKQYESEAGFEGLIGGSPEMNEVYTKIRKVAASDVSVLVIGESGTGKELVARAIHSQSARHEKPFVAINCGAIPENLLEAEFFGHEKGAYTSAHTQRRGKVEYSDGGTLFLDEIGEISPLLQVKLLRFLQERVVERIGGRETISVDVRVVAATQKNLKKALHTREFREDLYYRLSVVTIEVPPLRSRGNDILMLAHHFIRKSCQEMRQPMVRFGPNAIQPLLEYEWPGNVRELENRIKRAVVMGEGPIIEAEDLELSRGHNDAMKGYTLKDFRETSEKQFLCHALAINNWNIAQTAQQIGVSRPTIYDLMKKYDLQKHEFLPVQQ